MTGGGGRPSIWFKRIALLSVAASVTLEVGHLWLGRWTGSLQEGAS